MANATSVRIHKSLTRRPKPAFPHVLLHRFLLMGNANARKIESGETSSLDVYQPVEPTRYGTTNSTNVNVFQDSTESTECAELVPLVLDTIKTQPSAFQYVLQTSNPLTESAFASKALTAWMEFVVNAL